MQKITHISIYEYGVQYQCAKYMAKSNIDYKIVPAEIPYQVFCIGYCLTYTRPPLSLSLSSQRSVPFGCAIPHLCLKHQPGYSTCHFQTRRNRINMERLKHQRHSIINIFSSKPRIEKEIASRKSRPSPRIC